MSAIKDQKAFALISDGMQDTSKLEAQAVIVRYVEERDGMTRPVERPIDFFTCGDTSRAVWSEKILTTLCDVGLELH